MKLSARLTSIMALVAALSGDACAQAATDIAWFQPQYPAVFAPSNGFTQQVFVRAYSVWGTPNAWGAEVRIDVTCGEFSAGVTSMVTVVDSDSWVSDQGAWRAPAEEQDCSMIFTEVGNDNTSFALPIHVYDPAKVVMATDFGEYLITEASRPFQMTLRFFTEAGLPIMNNTVIPMVSKTQGASADELYLSYPTTTVDGIQYVSGLANNAVGEYELIIELQYSARWSIPVYQGIPLPRARKHWGAM
jgi:hypothetical protein